MYMIKVAKVQKQQIKQPPSPSMTFCLESREESPHKDIVFEYLATTLKLTELHNWKPTKCHLQQQYTNTASIQKYEHMYNKFSTTVTQLVLELFESYNSFPCLIAGLRNCMHILLSVSTSHWHCGLLGEGEQQVQVTGSVINMLQTLTKGEK